MCLLNLSWKGGHAQADSVGTGGGFITNDPYGANYGANYDASGGYSQQAGKIIRIYLSLTVFFNDMNLYFRVRARYFSYKNLKKVN